MKGVTTFLDKLHKGGKYAYYWKNKKTEWWEVGNRPHLPVDQANVYFPVHPLGQIPKENGRGKVMPPEYVRGKREDVNVINCIFAEFDAKDFDGSKENAFLHIKSLTLQPSVIIDSGGGYHCYWFLDDTLVIDSEEKRQEAILRQAKWVEFVGGDKGAKDLARVLRVPETMNTKYGESRRVHIVESTNIEYSIDEIDALITESIPVKSSFIEPYKDLSNDTDRAVMALRDLSDFRKHNYDDWLRVGMALSGLGKSGLVLWDNWSKESEKYIPGECAKKWETFTPNDGITLGSLIHWAREDRKKATKLIPHPPKGLIKPSDYERALTTLGYKFRMNEANYDVEVNGIRMSDPLEAVIHCGLRENEYIGKDAARDTWLKLAFENRYHPVLEYLNSLTWDGGDHISILASYFIDTHGVFPLWLKRWLIGAIARVEKEPRGQQNRMLVLDGKQNIGKSWFVRWLGSQVPGLHIESPINPEDKDSWIRLMSKWIWEVAELGATTRKSDRESLKHFISTENVTVRKSYGRHDTERPALASFIGTINNEAGFLSDPTGSRRFMVCTLKEINWDYDNEVDVGQVWAQAYYLLKSGEDWHLSAEEAEMAAEINAEYEVENPLEDHVLSLFIVDPSCNDFLPTIEISQTLRTNGVGINTKDKYFASEVGSILRKHGAISARKRIDGTQKRGWKGVSIRENETMKSLVDLFDR